MAMNSSTNINTSGLSGYAKQYALARNAGADDSTASRLATVVNRGTGLSKSYMSRFGSQPGVTYDTSGQAESPYTQSRDYQNTSILNSYSTTPVFKPADTVEGQKYNLSLLGSMQTPEGLGSLINSTINTAIPLPKEQTINLTYPSVNYVSEEEALQRAGRIIDPQTEASRASTLSAYAKQREILPQILNARGQLYGGLRAGGESQITQEQAIALDSLASQALAAKEQKAQNIQDSDYAKAKSLADAQYQQDYNNANMKTTAYNNALSLAVQERERAQNNIIALMKAVDEKEATANASAWEREKYYTPSASDSAALEWDKEKYGTPSASDLLNYDYKATKDAQDANLDWAKYGLDSSKTQYDINKPYYNPDTGSATESKNALAAVISDIKNYYASPTDYIASLRRNSGKLIQYLGTGGYEALLREAQSFIDTEISWERANKTTGDPIGEYFKSLGG